MRVGGRLLREGSRSRRVRGKGGGAGMDRRAGEGVQEGGVVVTVWE